MKDISKGEKMLQKGLVLVLTLVVPALAWGQKKSSAPAAPHASAPAHASAPSHAAAPSRSAPQGGGHATTNNRPMGGAQGGHSNTPANRGNTSTMGRGNTSTAGRGNTSTAGRGNTSTAGRGNTSTAGRGNTSTAGRGNTSTTGRGNTTAGRGNASTAGRGNNAGGKGNTTAGRGNNAGGRGAAHTPPGKNVSLKGGGSAHIRPNGQIRSVNKNGMHIEHGMHGGRKVVSTRNGARVVTNGRHGGYVQRAYVTRGGRSYYSRTYYYNGGYRSGVYVGYNYGGYPYYGYYPGYYYQPAYYGWAYNPWPAPVAYGWGWGGAPWYGYYGAYYQPYPVYPSAAFWLTDFLIASSLQAAYAAQAESQQEGLFYHDAGDGTLVASLAALAAAPGDDQAKLSPEVKKSLADEVKIALAAEQAEASKGGGSSGGGPGASKDQAPPALDPDFRTFVVSSDLSIVADGEECALSDGDVITRTEDTPDADRNVDVKVVASKKSDCAVGKDGPLAVDDLQEMYNHFREQLKDGMGELAKKQGTGGLPKAPDTSTKAGDVPPPEPDKTAEKTLKEQESAADQTESEVKQEAASSGGGSQ